MTEQTWLAGEDVAAMFAWMYRPRGPFLGASTGDPRRPNVEISERRLRLFAVACCRACWPLLTDERSRRAVEVVERFADGLATKEDLNIARATMTRPEMYPSAVYTAVWMLVHQRVDVGELLATLRFDNIQSAAVQANLLRDIIGNPFRPPPSLYHLEDKRGARKGTLAERVPCVEWLTPLVLSLAQAAYEDRPGRKCEQCCPDGPQWKDDGTLRKRPMKHCCHCHGTGTVQDGHLCPDRLAVLGDALEEAGCTEQAILRHLRGEELVPQPNTGNPPLTFWRKTNKPHVRGCAILDCLLGKE